VDFEVVFPGYREDFVGLEFGLAFLFAHFSISLLASEQLHH
jgi:hypothetical protein